jgi:hypothetical protein
MAAAEAGSRPSEASEPMSSQSEGCEDVVSKSDVFSPLNFSKNAVKIYLGNGNIVAREIEDTNVAVLRKGDFLYLYHNGLRVKFVQCAGCKGIFTFSTAASYGTTGLSKHASKCLLLAQARKFQSSKLPMLLNDSFLYLLFFVESAAKEKQNKIFSWSIINRCTSQI